MTAELKGTVLTKLKITFINKDTHEGGIGVDVCIAIPFNGAIVSATVREVVGLFSKSEDTSCCEGMEEMPSSSSTALCTAEQLYT